jgi:hypothetical protein
VLAGSLVVPVLWGLGRKRGKEEHVELARVMVKVWLVAISFAITTGVAPLLFVQVLYGHFFYTANILLGWRWLGLLAVLTFGFYGVYVLNNVMQRDRGGIGLALMLLLALAFLWIAHELTNNSVLMLLPELWRDMYGGTIGKHARHPMWPPRFMHWLVGSIAITGLWMAGIGRVARSLPEAARRCAVGLGLKIAAIATGLQVITGFWFLLMLDKSSLEAMVDFPKVRPLLWLSAAVIGAMLGHFMWMRSKQPDKARSVWIPVGLIGLVLIGMSAGREIIRLEMLSRTGGPLYGPDDVRLQFGPLLMFAISLVVGLGIVAMMLRWVWTARGPAQKETPGQAKASYLMPAVDSPESGE